MEMSIFESLTLAINVLVLGTAVWIIRSSHASTQVELKANRTALQSLINSLHALELKLTNCVTWQELDRICTIEKCKVDELHKRVNKHGTQIAILEQRGK